MPIFSTSRKTFYIFWGRFKIRETSTALVIKLSLLFPLLFPSVRIFCGNTIIDSAWVQIISPFSLSPLSLSHQHKRAHTYFLVHPRFHSLIHSHFILGVFGIHSLNLSLTRSHTHVFFFSLSHPLIHIFSLLLPDKHIFTLTFLHSLSHTHSFSTLCYS